MYHLRRNRVDKALANEDTLLRTHCCRHKCFPVCPRAQHLLRTQKMFLILFRNILCPQQMFPSLRSIETHEHEQHCVRNNMSSFASTYNSCTRHERFDWSSTSFNWFSNFSVNALSKADLGFTGCLLLHQTDRADTSGIINQENWKKSFPRWHPPH